MKNSTIRAVITYDFSCKHSKSFIFYRYQIPNLGLYLSCSENIFVTIICIGQPPQDLISSVERAKFSIFILDDDSSSVISNRIVFSNKLRIIDLIKKNLIRSDERLLLIDHDIFFLKPPFLFQSIPSNMLAVKSDPLNRISKEIWNKVGLSLSVGNGILGYSLPDFHVREMNLISNNIRYYLYFNTGIVLLPSGNSGVDLLESWLDLIKRIDALPDPVSGITNCDQYAFAIVAQKFLIYRLNSSHNFQALNILEGYRFEEIEAIHFSGFSGVSMPESIEHFSNKAHAMLNDLNDIDNKIQFSQLIDEIIDGIKSKLVCI